MARSDPAVANGWWRRALFIRRTSNYAFRILTVLLPGYLRKNGAPYSGRAVVREYYDVFTVGSNDRRFTVTTIVEDPEYLSTPFVTSSDFKRQSDATGWSPTKC